MPRQLRARRRPRRPPRTRSRGCGRGSSGGSAGRNRRRLQGARRGSRGCGSSSRYALHGTWPGPGWNGDWSSPPKATRPSAQPSGAASRATGHAVRHLPFCQAGCDVRPAQAARRTRRLRSDPRQPPAHQVIPLEELLEDVEEELVGERPIQGRGQPLARQDADRLADDDRGRAGRCGGREIDRSPKIVKGERRAQAVNRLVLARPEAEAPIAERLGRAGGRRRRRGPTPSMPYASSPSRYRATPKTASTTSHVAARPSSTIAGGSVRGPEQEMRPPPQSPGRPRRPSAAAQEQGREVEQLAPAGPIGEERRAHGRPAAEVRQGRGTGRRGPRGLARRRDRDHRAAVAVADDVIGPALGLVGAEPHSRARPAADRWRSRFSPLQWKTRSRAAAPMSSASSQPPKLSGPPCHQAGPSSRSDAAKVPWTRMTASGRLALVREASSTAGPVASPRPPCAAGSCTASTPSLEFRDFTTIYRTPRRGSVELSEHMPSREARWWGRLSPTSAPPETPAVGGRPQQSVLRVARRPGERNHVADVGPLPVA